MPCSSLDLGIAHCHLLRIVKIPFFLPLLNSEYTFAKTAAYPAKYLDRFRKERTYVQFLKWFGRCNDGWL